MKLSGERRSVPVRADNALVSACRSMPEGRARHAALLRQEPAHRQAVLLPPPFSAIISRMPTDLLNPCNDYVFKRLFAASPLLLADLINAVRSEALRMKWSKCSIPASNRKNSWANSSSSISWRRTARDGVTTSR
jgi:hypothetical protein